jgi:uroporphyrinogen decarboxylase
MNHIDRVLCAFSHRQTDKVPKGEFGIDRNLIPRLIKQSVGNLFEDTLAVLDRLRVDLTGVESTETRSPKKELVGRSESGRSIVRDSWGAVYLQSDYGTLPAAIIESPIQAPDDIYRFEMPAVRVFDEAVSDVRKWQEQTDYFVFANVWGPFSGAMTELMGWENYMVWTITNLKELEHLTKSYVAYQAELAKRYIDAGAHGILIAGDLAGNDGPFFHPELMRELIFPNLKMQVDIIKNHRPVPVVYHSDGNINQIMDDLVQTGIDGINPLESHAGMDLALMKKRYGERLCILGNVDTNFILPRGTPEAVSQEVKRIIDVAYPGGGFILQAANLLTPDIPVENILAMYETAEHYPVTR